MYISASVQNSFEQHLVTVVTEGNEKQLFVPSGSRGYGSSVNGGELLFLALATCFCNDIYREAAKRKMKIEAVEVRVWGEFGKEGEPANNIRYEVEVRSPASEKEVHDLVMHVDQIAEVHITMRKGTTVSINISP